MAPANDITRVLNAASGGDATAVDQLMTLIYDELRQLARGQMAHESPGDTLQPTALVHEAWMRLFGEEEVQWDCRAHFFGAAARAMRRILVEHARSRGRLKRGGGRRRVDFEDVQVQDKLLAVSAEDLLGLDEALDRLEQLDRRKSDIVHLRYFAGLTVADTARVLEVSPATVKSDWAFARAWLHSAIAGHDDDVTPDT